MEKTYKQYFDNWLKENPPFSGPYLAELLSEKEWEEKQKNNSKYDFNNRLLEWNCVGFLGYKTKK
jgi:hypothetical protein